MDLRPRTILVIEDEPRLLELFREVLAAEGYAVRLTASGREGLAQVGGGGIDLVVTDHFMPDVDGLEVLRTVRREQPAVPVIVLSGGGSRDHVEILDVARMLGAARVLEKPVYLADLMAAVRECLPAP